MRIYIYKGGWFNGSRISQKEFEKIVGVDKLKAMKHLLINENKKKPTVRTVSITIEGIEYDLTFDIQ